MARLLWLPSELRAAGCKVRTVDGWRTRGRPGVFEPFGVLWHHTGFRASKENPHPALGTLIRGTPALTGPLCQISPGFDGVLRIVAAGRANHAGTNDGTGTGPIPAGDGNAQMVGLEFDYSGSQDMSDVQWESGVKGSAVILRHFKKDQSFVRGHKETSTAGKWDPGRHGASSPQYLMDDVRKDVRLALEPKWKFQLAVGKEVLAQTGPMDSNDFEDELAKLTEFFNNRRGLILRRLRDGNQPRFKRVKA